MDNVKQMVVVARVNLNEHVVPAGGIVTLGHLGNLAKLLYHVIKIFGILQEQAHISAGFITYFLGVDDELGASQDT